MEKFKYLGMVFTSDGRRNKEIDTTSIGKANAVLRAIYRSVVKKWSFDNTEFLNWSSFLPSPTIINLG